MNKEARDNYTVMGTVAKAGLLKCHLCGEYPTIKSNQAVAEEVARLSASLVTHARGCPTPACPNQTIDIEKHGFYQSFGKTRSGSKRYRCKACGKTFSIGASTVRQKKPHKDIMVFRLLVNKVPFRRICEIAGIRMPALYNKIDFFQKQCLLFSGEREASLQGKFFRRLYIGVDRQDYVINWTRTQDKRNIVIRAVGSADNKTGYVFGMHTNFDPSLDPSLIEEAAKNCDDYDKHLPYRRYARLWLKRDYHDSLMHEKIKKMGGKKLMKRIEGSYEDAVAREDVEVSDDPDFDTALPVEGMQIHGEYTLYGHFFFLRKLLARVEKVRFFLDQDSGMRAACLSAFMDRIREGRCDVFYVRINSDLTIDEKRTLMADTRRRIEDLKRAFPEHTDSQIKLMVIKERMKQLMAIGKWQDRWLAHPFPDMSEPEKAICYLTDINNYDEDHTAWLYNKASLHGIDRFFMQVRRRLSLLERPISTSSNLGRKWYGYGPYNPAMVGKLLDIFRVFYNYVEVGKDNQTPSMRIGLSKGIVSIEDVVYYQ